MSGPSENPEAPRPASSLGNTADTLRERRLLDAPLGDSEARAVMARRSRRSFLVAASTAVAGGLGLWWLLDPRRQGIFDRVLGFNEKLGRGLFRRHALAPEFARSLAAAPRVNGTEGMSEDFDLDRWRLQVTGLANVRPSPRFAADLTYHTAVNAETAQKFPATPAAGLLLTLNDIRALPRVEMTTELKCIEGWSTIVHWAGARVSDFVAQYSPAAEPGDLPPYVSLVTPDRGYYVGWDTPSILHPQTLLCYEMNGEPLPLAHGGPLRLVTTAKYGIKQIKRIGRMAFTDQRPADYWAERGYDWYSGL
jgi:hypothetical protein